MPHKQNENFINKTENLSISNQPSVNEKRPPEYEPTFLNPYL
ncbi:hypothetical protein RKD56_000009 [Priestia megaterium]|jgi:hypothetical protein